MNVKLLMINSQYGYDKNSFQFGISKVPMVNNVILKFNALSTINYNVKNTGNPVPSIN